MTGVWFGGLKTRWPVVPIKRIARLGTGHTPDRANREYWIEDECVVPWVTVADIQTLPGLGLAPLLETEQHISERGLAHSAAVLHEPGTVMLSRTASIGFSCRIGRPMATTQAFVTWTPGPEINSLYLLLALKALRPELDRLAYGSTHLTIYMPDVETLTVPLPPLPQQRAIADYLDRETARIDALIAKKRRMIEVLDERDGVLVEEALAQAAVGEVPLRRLLVGLPQYGAAEAGVPGDEDWPRYIRITDLTESGDLRSDGVLRLPPTVARPYLLHDGDLLLARSGATVGKAFLYRDQMGSAAFAGYLIRIRPDRDKIDPELFAAWTRTRHYWSQVRLASLQATIENVSAEKYKDFVVPFVPRRHQDAVLSTVRTGRLRNQGVRSALSRQIELLYEHRQALITAAVTGDVEKPGVAA